MTPEQVRNRAADMCKASGDTETARADAAKLAGEKEMEDRARHRAATSYFLEKRIREDDGTNPL
jgi:hypothetical protein